MVKVPLGACNLLRGFAVVAGIAVVLFVSAGRWDLPFFWAYVGLNAALWLLSLFTLDPGLMQERWHPGPGGKDLLPMLLVAVPACLAYLIVAGLDVGRFHWSDSVPATVQVAALGVSALAWGLVWWAMVVNPFFSGVVRIQEERGHRLVTSGPYHYIRHPGYTGAIIGFLFSPLALGSWWALGVIVPAVFMLLRRASLEDRFLHQHLPGYAGYAQHVRYRLVPGLW